MTASPLGPANGVSPLASPEYRARVEAGGCCNLHCREQGQHEYAVWWKCAAGHRMELLYCRVHGPLHLETAKRGGMLKCWECDDLMTPLIEGWRA